MNILPEISKIKKYIEELHKEGHESSNGLNKRNLDVALFYAFILDKANKEFLNKRVSYTFKTSKDLFRLILINGFEASFYSCDFKFPFNDIKNMGHFVLSKDLRMDFKNVTKFFIPNTQRELSLIKEVNANKSSPSFMEEIYSSRSIDIKNSNPCSKDLIDSVYEYNCITNTQAISDFSTFICFVNSYHKNVVPEFTSKVNPENGRQSFFVGKTTKKKQEVL